MYINTSLNMQNNKIRLILRSNDCRHRSRSGKWKNAISPIAKIKSIYSLFLYIIMSRKNDKK